MVRSVSYPVQWCVFVFCVLSGFVLFFVCVWLCVLLHVCFFIRLCLSLVCLYVFVDDNVCLVCSSMMCVCGGGWCLIFTLNIFFSRFSSFFVSISFLFFFSFVFRLYFPLWRAKKLFHSWPPLTLLCVLFCAISPLSLSVFFSGSL